MVYHSVLVCPLQPCSPRPLAAENILLTSTDDLSSVKVADFGLSQSFGPEDEPEVRRMHQFCGTMAFMVRAPWAVLPPSW